MRKKYESNEENIWATWFEHISIELSENGLMHLWDREGDDYTTEYIKAAAGLRFRDVFKQNWHSVLLQHEFCDFYKLIKDEFGFMNYLSKMPHYQFRILGKWRCISNYIPIASSRFNITDAILYPFCRDESVGDEIHYLCKCPFFTSERLNLIPKFVDCLDQEMVVRNFEYLDEFETSQLISFLNIVLGLFGCSGQWNFDIIF